MAKLAHTFSLLLITIFINGYYHHCWDEEIDVGRFGLPTVSHLECGVARAVVIALYGISIRILEGSEVGQCWGFSQHQPLNSLSSESVLLSCPIITRSTGQIKLNCFCHRICFHHTMLTKVWPTHFLFVSNSGIPYFIQWLCPWNYFFFWLNTVNNSVNTLWGSYKKNLLFQGIPRWFFFPS